LADDAIAGAFADSDRGNEHHYAQRKDDRNEALGWIEHDC